jgi:hypothetical protein
MEGKPAAPSRDVVRAAILRLAVAHNRAVLAGMTIALAATALLVALALAGPQLAGGTGVLARLVGVPIIAVALIIGWRGVRLHRLFVRDLGAGRAAAAALAVALLERGDEASFKEVGPIVGADVGRGAEVLARLDLLSTREEAGEVRLSLDGARLRSVIGSPA